MKNLLVLLISFAILSNVSIAWSQSGDNTQCDDPTSSLLWQVKGKNSTVYLFGTLHFGKASFYPLADEIETAFRKADHLVFEIDANKAQEAEFAIKMQQLGLYPPGQSLADAISKESLEQVITVSRDLGLPRETLLQFRPWFLTLSLTAQHLVGLGYLPDYGIESYLGREKSSATQLQELESLDEQLKFMQKLDSEAYLTLTLDTLDQGEDLLQGLAHAWECADKQLLQELLVESFESDILSPKEAKELKDIFLINRNRNMAEKISEYLNKGSGSYFVAVGAAHYLGDGSIIEILSDKGFKAEPVSLSAE